MAITRAGVIQKLRGQAKTLLCGSQYLLPVNSISSSEAKPATRFKSVAELDANSFTADGVELIHQRANCAY